MTKIVISGALGRMGKRIRELAEKDRELEITGLLEKVPRADLGIFSSLNDLKKGFDCVIEFTTPEATLLRVKEAKKLEKAIVIGTTGLSKEQQHVIYEASLRIPIVFAPNMSCGVNLFLSLIGKSAGVLGKDYRVSVKEAHHVHKQDKPSGTAKLMREIVKKSLERDEEISIESVRRGEIVGDHEIVFESEVDTIKISHSAKTRDIFALGALKAAKFVVKKKKGMFDMLEVLGLKPA
ncbi:MAG: 4-hydroxy-tetrahydrodipicolinate reductase [Candidatus Omnitrophica bacterium]|nr:4-hydroxy-tetrahydrodipicolinate reductase [Candidatus Omnitrophota bacterium]